MGKKGIKNPRTPFLFNLGDNVIHVKTEGSYIVVGLPDEYTIEETGEPAYVYHKKGSRRKYVRSQSLMEDGRFIIKQTQLNL